VCSVVIPTIHTALGKQPFKGQIILHTDLLALIGFLKAKVLVIHLPTPVPHFPHSVYSSTLKTEAAGSSKIPQKTANFRLHVFTQNIAQIKVKVCTWPQGELQ
jgi:hypothetical protein